MRFADMVRATDAGFARLCNSAGALLARRSWGEERSVVEVKGWVRLVCRERGKIVPGTHRESWNVWTNTGREYLSQRISIDPAFPTTTMRTDAIAYIGVGIGTQAEEPGVLKLITPIEYDQGIFLADIRGVEFPVYPVRTTVEYRRTFAETEISTGANPGTVLVSELGLFTNGDPKSVPAYTFNTRKRGMVDSADAAPVAYKTFEPVGKTSSMQLEVAWQIRF